jgi:hypothetical protein
LGGRKTTLFFYAGSGAVYDLEEFAVGAQSQGLFIRVADRNNGECFPRLKTITGSFLAFVAYSDSGLDAFLNWTFIIAKGSSQVEQRSRCNLAIERSRTREGRVVSEALPIFWDIARADEAA